MEFDAKASSVSWVDKLSGDFVTASQRVGVVKVWNVALTEAKDTVKVSQLCITSIEQCGEDLFLFLIDDGSVALYNMKSRKMHY